MKRIALALLIFMSLPCFADEPQKSHTNNETAAKTWSKAANGVHFSLTQILSEQGNAFYVNRGFTQEAIKPYTNSCVFMTVLRNDNADGTIHFISNNWAVKTGGKSHVLTSVDQWMKKLATENQIPLKKSALIAFRWAQFPPEQEYEPGGDWNQGMLSIGLPAGSQFDITAKWDINGKPYQIQLHGVQCGK